MSSMIFWQFPMRLGIKIKQQWIMMSLKCTWKDKEKILKFISHVKKSSNKITTNKNMSYFYRN